VGDTAKICALLCVHIRQFYPTINRKDANDDDDNDAGVAIDAVL